MSDFSHVENWKLSQRLVVDKSIPKGLQTRAKS